MLENIGTFHFTLRTGDQIQCGTPKATQYKTTLCTGIRIFMWVIHPDYYNSTKSVKIV